MRAERLVKRRRRKTCRGKTEVKKISEKSNGAPDIMRLERKKVLYDMQEMALKKMQRIVIEQMMKVEVEGLQLAANIREKEAEEYTVSFEVANLLEDVNKIPFSLETVDFDNAKEINKHELDLDGDLGDILFNDYYPAAEEDDDDEDELKFHYLQEFKSEVK